MNPVLRARLRNALIERRRGPRGDGSPRPRRSDGYEFAELRAYVAGDDIRRIDWAATARAGGLQTRVLFEDHSLVLGAVVDASGSMQMGRSRPLYTAACEAAEAWYGLAEADDRCGRFGETSGVFLGRRGPAAAHLCTIERAVDPATSLDAALHVALAALPWDASLLLISDFFDLNALEGMLRLCTRRFDVTALVARDPWYAGFPLRGFVRLHDAESGESMRAFIGKRAARRILDASALRERATVARLEALGARTAVFDERDGEVALLRAFGIAP